MGGVPVSSGEARMAAADLFSANLMGKLSSINYATPQLRRAILLFYSIVWGARVLAAFGGESIITHVTPTLPSSRLPKGDISSLLNSFD